MVLVGVSGGRVRLADSRGTAAVTVDGSVPVDDCAGEKGVPVGLTGG